MDSSPFCSVLCVSILSRLSRSPSICVFIKVSSFFITCSSSMPTAQTYCYEQSITVYRCCVSSAALTLGWVWTWRVDSGAFGVASVSTLPVFGGIARESRAFGWTGPQQRRGQWGRDTLGVIHPVWTNTINICLYVTNNSVVVIGLGRFILEQWFFLVY